MYFLYIDESGSNTSHFVLLGIAIHASSWRDKMKQISFIKDRYDLGGKEIHAGWLSRRYLEQERISDFESLNRVDRRAAVEKERKASLVHISALGSPQKLRSTKKTFEKTKHYIHLTLDERKALLRELADLIGSWTDCRLFAEAMDKRTYNLPKTPFEEGFTAVVSRFHYFLDNYSRYKKESFSGLIIQDNNESMAKRLTEMMKGFHKTGTLWTQIPRIVETPLFVNSELTGMIQMADVCAYVTRRFFENKEEYLFNRIYKRFDRLAHGKVVGIRHYTGAMICTCKVCIDH